MLLTWPQIVILLSGLLLGYGSALPYRSIDRSIDRRSLDRSTLERSLDRQSFDLDRSIDLDRSPYRSMDTYRYILESEEPDTFSDTNSFSDFIRYELSEDDANRPYKRTAIFSRLYEMAVEEENHPRRKRPDGVLGLDNMDYAAAILDRGRQQEEGGGEGGTAMINEEASDRRPSSFLSGEESSRPRIDLLDRLRPSLSQPSSLPGGLSPGKPKPRPSSMGSLLSQLRPMSPGRPRRPGGFKPSMQVTGMSVAGLRKMIGDLRKAGR